MANLYFGTTIQSVLNLMPGSVGSIQSCDFGGDVVLAQIIEIYYNRLLAQLSPTTFEMIARPDREQIIRYSPADVSTVILGLFPIKANTQVRLFTDPDFYDSNYQFSQVVATITNATTGQISFNTIPANTDLWASYEVDLDTVLIPSLANMIKYGVAGELLIKATPKDSFGYNLGVMYQKIWDDSITSLKDNDYAIPELRKLTFWNQSTDMPSIVSMRKLRDS